MLIPVAGCLVRTTVDVRTGEVREGRGRSASPEVAVLWAGATSVEWVRPDSLLSGFTVRASVEEVPRSRLRPSLGIGEIMDSRILAGRGQHLVEFPGSGKRVWLPFQNLRYVRGPRQRFLLGRLAPNDVAERFRLRALSCAIESWHENTGALARMNIDPLPHQIHLVHHILKSGNLNWLIADDVGLGKTVEAGMLLSALKQRGSVRRVLLVTPAGLVRQWKEEMHHKFGLSEFRIYGEDFFISEERDWKHYDYVIGSLDRLKHENHLARLTQSGHWDLVVFDEAHRLSRTQFGMKFDSSERFQLARTLRRMTDSVVLLSATPHQGRPDRFQALLELLRPEWTEQIRSLALDPSILSQMVIRNSKSDVTDVAGNLIFTGKVTKAIAVPVEPEAIEFDRVLQQYLKKGYAAGKETGDRTGRAIGFVMTVYRKLAASSVAAIETALARRLQRMEPPPAGKPHEARPSAAGMWPGVADSAEPDGRYAGELEERDAEEGAGSERAEFFHGERDLLRELVTLARRLRRKDAKLHAFCEELVGQIVGANPKEKVLVFTEYRTTQDYIHEALCDGFGKDSVSLIHGGMDHQERAASIDRFESTGQFLVSTEAGAEGINLQRHCHVMVNFDLPWNPMRLVQRVGRLYRYGQKKKVVVFNLHAPQTLDAQIMTTLYQRVDQVVSDMASLGGEFNDALRDDIMGEVADLLDVDAILEKATEQGKARTDESLREAVESAKQAAAKQRELFEHFSGFSAEETRGELRIGRNHVRAFVMGMCDQLGIEAVLGRDGASAQLRIPDDLRDRFGLKGSQVRVLFDRNEARSATGNTISIDFETPFFRALVEEARRPVFGGLVARIGALPGEAVLAAMLRWQDDQGRRIRQEFAAVLVGAAGQADINPQVLSDWLLEPARDGNRTSDREHAANLHRLGMSTLESRLDRVSNERVHPENIELVACAWVQGEQ